jgi:uncharacterized DUF497 family protein
VNYYKWNIEKNIKLKKERGVNFEDIVLKIDSGCVLDVIDHPNQNKYKGQKVFIVEMNDYVYMVPYTTSDNIFFLKTIIPSRKATKKYL